MNKVKNSDERKNLKKRGLNIHSILILKARKQLKATGTEITISENTFSYIKNEKNLEKNIQNLEEILNDFINEKLAVNPGFNTGLVKFAQQVVIKENRVISGNIDDKKQE